MLTLLHAIVGVGLWSIPFATQGSRSFYLDPNGDDENDGRSPTKAWRSIPRLNEEKLKSGDHVFFASGAKFEGSIVLKASEAGTSAKPLVFSSDGSPATIISRDGSGFTAAAGGIELQNLRFEGQATAKKKGHLGVAFLANGRQGQKYAHVRIKNVEVSGFGDTGIAIGSQNKTLTGFNDVLISGCNSHENYGAGIASWDNAGDRAQGYAHHDITVKNCVVRGNLSGTGMVLSGVDGCLIEDCRATGNTGEGGGVGLWAYSAKNVRFAYCICNETRSGGGDGGGFDLDGGCVDCVIENCLAYENDGPGYMHCDYPTAAPTRGNVMRHCVSVNDGRKAKGDNVGFGFVTWGSGLDDCILESNRCYVTEAGAKDRRVGALFVTYINGSQGKDDKLHVLSSLFRDNQVRITAPGVDFVDDNSPPDLAGGVQFEGNAYFGHAAFGLAGKRYDTFSEWKKEGHDVGPSNGSMPDLGDYRLTSTDQLRSFAPLHFR